MSAYVSLPLEAWEERAREVCHAIDQKVMLNVVRSKDQLKNFSSSSSRVLIWTFWDPSWNKDLTCFFSHFLATLQSTQAL